MELTSTLAGDLDDAYALQPGTRSHHEPPKLQNDDSPDQDQGY